MNPLTTLLPLLAALITTASPTGPTYQPPATCPSNGYLPPNASTISPSLIVPISARSPNTALGPTTNPLITPSDICTIFNLPLPPTAANKTCSLRFLFPTQDQLLLSPSTSTYAYTGPGHFTFTGYAIGAGAEANTTYAHQPAAGPNPPSPPSVLSPGNAYVINESPCGTSGVGETVVSGALCSNDTYFEFRQDAEACAIGFFVVLS
ncbi:hypothetical protein K490DRAFT_45570 [Saccharata proteae CBS 121410]|uniref:Ubiquitin 3 binding protein But2 C-terminal domain-containing protein n=1 Tax=Saccharata proteae CBS 121410 TaxID=1314787 RepID=A0A9P4LW25_9PEZI|nr:hypothetical protein K490DRAFT_45570 [Saccharata proteae CBS 121410]